MRSSDGDHGGGPYTRAGGRPRRPRRGPAPRAVAGHRHRPPRQPRAAEPERDQGRRPPGLERVDGLAHDRAVVRAPRGARPRVGQAARLAGPARDQLPARSPGPRPTCRACASTAAFSPIRAARRTPTPSTTRPGASGSAPPRRSGARWPIATSPGTSTCRAAGARSRCWATPSSTRAPCGRRSSTRWWRGWARCCGSSTSTASRWTASSPTSPPDVSWGCSRRPAGTPRRSSTAGACARCSSATAARRCAPASTRWATRSTSGCCAPTTSSCASACPAASRRSRASSPTSTRASCSPPSATSAVTTSRPCSPPIARPTRSATARRSSSPTRSRAGRCPPRATRPTTRRCSPTSSSSTSPSSWAPTRASRGGPSTPSPPEGRLCAAAAGRLEREPVEAHEPPPVPAELGRQHTGTGSTQQALGRLFVDLDHDAPDVSATRGHRRARRRVVDQPRRLDQPQRHLEHRRAHRLVRRRLRHAGALARVRPRAPRRARHRRGQPRRAARRARRDVEPRRASAAAGGHDLRPLRHARARAVVVRHLRRRAVDPRRDAVGDHAGTRGRRAPVGRHAVGRDRAARLRGVGAGLHPGLRVVVPARARRAGARRRQLGLLPPVDATDRPGARGRAARGPRARAAPRRRAGRRLPPARRASA